MSQADVSWVDHALDWMWAVIASAAAVLGGAIVRLWRHEERLKALEVTAKERAEVLQDLSEKVDRNHSSVTDRIDALGKDIRDDLRIIMGRCLNVTHGA